MKNPSHGGDKIPPEKQNMFMPDIEPDMGSVESVMTFFHYAVEYGIMSPEDAERMAMTHFENRIKAVFLELSDREPSVIYLQSNQMYSVRIPKAVRETHDLKERYFNKTREGLIETLYRDIFVSDKSMTLTDLFGEWIAKREDDEDIPYSTVYHNKQDFAKYLAGTPLADKPVRTLTVDDLNALFLSMTKGRQMTVKAFNNFKSMLNMLFDLAILKGLVPHNISREIKGTNYKFKACSNRSVVYTTEERNKLFAVLKESDNVYDLAIALMLCLGCRVGEVKALHWEDIDLDKRTLYIHREIVNCGTNEQTEKNHTKSGQTEGNRELPIVDEAMMILLKVKALCIDDEYVFLGRSGQFLTTGAINSHLKEVCKQTGVPYFSSHKIRAWAATASVQNGADEVTAMYAFGWKDRETMQKYIRAGRTHIAKQDVFMRTFDSSTNA